MSAFGSTWGSLVVGVLLGAGTARAAAARSEPAAAEAAPAAAAVRWREGELLEEQVGTLELSGERVQCTLAGSQRTLPVLENLALERVVRLLDQQVAGPWLITGLVTEYRGRNYLLLQRAVVRTVDGAPAQRPPDRPRS